MGRIGKDQLAAEMREYFASIKEKPTLLIEVVGLNKPHISLTIENMTVLFLIDTYDLYEFFDVKAMVVPKKNYSFSNAIGEFSTVVKYRSETFFSASVDVSVNADKGENEDDSADENGEFRGCRNPSVHMWKKRMHVAGLSAVLRFLLKFACGRLDLTVEDNESERRAEKLDALDKLLGYQRGCLQACAESSIWTKFCEVDMIKMVCLLEAMILGLNKDAISSGVDNEVAGSLSSTGRIYEIPKDLLRFEYHLSRPVRIHNFRKRIQADKVREAGENNQPTQNYNQEEMEETRAKNVSGKDQQIRVKAKQLQKTEDLELHPTQISHDFAEGPDFTLADLLLFPCVDLALVVLGTELFKKYLPRVYAWHQCICQLLPLRPQVVFEQELLAQTSSLLSQMDVEIPEIPQESLYKSDPLRYKAKLRLFTKQDDIETALHFLSGRGIQALNFNEDKISAFDWDHLPRLVHPEGGQLPPNRIEKKSQQLSNLALMVEKVFRDNYDGSLNRAVNKITIVDFCSGGGHLGILLAYMLPECRIILVENKEESLRRAESRVKTLGLPNVSFFQCNLDYFTGHFEIGVALHACGTATDLVLAKCVQKRASFVCCPCCYGAIQSNHMLHYPRSSTFLDIVSSSNGLFPLKHYFVLGHAADQTHDEANEKTSQGNFCMRMIDTDRCFHAQENNYQVILRRMQPFTCSPKNHILVGVPLPS